MALGKGGLRVCPYHHTAVFLDTGSFGIRLDIPLMHDLGAKRPFEDDIRLFKPFGGVASAHFQMLGNIARRGLTATGGLGVEIVVEPHRFRLHGVDCIEHVGQHFVLDPDEPKGGLGNGF